MDDDRKRPPVVPLVAVGVLALLPVLYVAAIGPLAALFQHGYITENSTVGNLLEVIYLPLLVCSQSCPPLESFLEWYIKACGGQ
jgi:hypothetical protein